MKLPEADFKMFGRACFMDRGRRTTGMIDPIPSQRVLGDSIQGQDAAGHPVLTLRQQRPGVPKALCERWRSKPEFPSQ